MRLRIPVVGIVRGVDPGFFGELMEASFAAGLQALEITMNTEGAEQIVRRQISFVPPDRLLGMGTIRNVGEAERAVEAGAMFLVTPNTDTAVLEYGRLKGVPVVSGALTPTEIQAARTGGASMVKVFPCGSLGGPRYIEELRGPFEGIPLMAVGGVSLSNVAEYFRAGADAVGVGASLFGRQALREKDPKALEENVRSFVERVPGRA